MRRSRRDTPNEANRRLAPNSTLPSLTIAALYKHHWQVELFFDPDEIRAAHLLTKTRIPAQPKLNEVLRLIARLGGFLARKGDGEPGSETIWKGFTKVHVAAKAIRLLRDDGDADTSV